MKLIAVDGPSGAGKTTYAAGLGAPVVHADDLLDGWDDQLTVWPRLAELVLEPLRRGEPAVYHPYDWTAKAFSAETITVPPAPVVVIEGFGSARREIRHLLSYVVFVDAPADLRLARALARDGDDTLAYRAYLERWRGAEDRHFAADGTREAADLIVDGDGTTESGKRL